MLKLLSTLKNNALKIPKVSIANGRVAADEAVPKAVAKTFVMFQKNWKGRVRVSAPENVVHVTSIFVRNMNLINISLNLTTGPSYCIVKSCFILIKRNC